MFELDYTARFDASYPLCKAHSENQMRLFLCPSNPRFQHYVTLTQTLLNDLLPWIGARIFFEDTKYETYKLQALHPRCRAAR